MGEVKTLSCGHPQAEEPEHDGSVWCLICAVWVYPAGHQAEQVVVDALVLRVPDAPSPPSMERLASLEHDSWAGWTKFMLSQIETELGEAGAAAESAVGPKGLEARVLAAFGELTCVKRWRRQMVTDYAGLSEKERESDRHQVHKKWPLYAEAFAHGAP